MPQLPSGPGSMTPPILPLPSVMMSMKALRSSASASAERILGSLNGATSRLTIRLIGVVGRLQLADGLRQLRLDVLA